MYGKIFSAAVIALTLLPTGYGVRALDANDYLGTCSDNYSYSSINHGVSALYSTVFNDNGSIRRLDSEESDKSTSEQVSRDPMDESHILDNYHMGWLQWFVPHMCLAKHRLGYSIEGAGTYTANIIVGIATLLSVIVYFLHHLSIATVAILFKITGVLEVLQKANRIPVYVQLFALSLVLSAIVVMWRYRNRYVSDVFNITMWIFLIIALFSFFTVSSKLAEKDAISKRYTWFLEVVDCVPATIEDSLVSTFFNSNNGDDSTQQRSCVSGDIDQVNRQERIDGFDRTIALVLFEMWKGAIFGSSDKAALLKKNISSRYFRVYGDYFIDTHRSIPMYLLWSTNESVIDPYIDTLSKPEYGENVDDTTCYKQIDSSKEEALKEIKQATYTCIKRILRKNVADNIQNPSSSILYAVMSLIVLSLLFYLLIPSMLASVIISILTLIFFFVMPLLLIISVHKRRVILSFTSRFLKIIVQLIFYIVQGYVVMAVFLEIFNSSALGENALLRMLLFCLLLSIFLFIRRRFMRNPDIEFHNTRNVSKEHIKCLSCNTGKTYYSNSSFKEIVNSTRDVINEIFEEKLRRRESVKIVDVRASRPNKDSGILNKPVRSIRSNVEKSNDTQYGVKKITYRERGLDKDSKRAYDNMLFKFKYHRYGEYIHHLLREISRFKRKSSKTYTERHDRGKY